MDYLEIAGALIGLLYLWFEYKASIWLWPISVIMPAIYVVVYFRVGLYADSGISIYYLLAGAYGWWMWLRGISNEKEKPVTATPCRAWGVLVAVFCVLFIVIGKGLELWTNSDVPWWDSFITALSVIAMWMLAHKYVEQWLVWIVVDVVSCGLYVYKDLYFTSALYGIYTLIAWFGYLKWKQLMHADR